MALLILLDVDGVLADLVGACCERFAPERTEADVIEWDMGKCLRRPALWRDILSHVKHDQFCRTLPLYEGAQQFVATLEQLGEVHACTAPASGEWMAQRCAWLEAHFGIPLKRQHHTHGKDIGQIGGDVLIDDKPESVAAFGARHGLGVLLDRPWNRHTPIGAAAANRALDYAHVLRLVEAERDLRRAVR